MSTTTLRALLMAMAAAMFSHPPLTVAQSQHPADLIMHGGKVWTVDEAMPVAEAVAVRGNRIIVVGSDADALVLRGPETRVIDLAGQLVLPGFNDGHTHFENAADWFFEVMVTNAQNPQIIYDELRAAVERVPEGMWITSGIFATFGKPPPRGRPDEEGVLFMPDIAIVDEIAPNHPVFLKRYDGKHFANSKAFEVMRYGRHTPNPIGGEFVRDPETGEFTGVLLGTARDRIEQGMAPRSRASKLIGARAVVEKINRNGITTIHDIARIDEISQRQIFHTHLERSNSDMGIFDDLRARGELTLRLRPLLTLAVWDELESVGIKPGDGDDLIRYYGGLKAFVDGSLMYEGRTGTPAFTGNFTFRVVDPEVTRNDIINSTAAGFVPGIHVIGDKAINLLLDWYEEAIEKHELSDPRFRVIHMFYPTAADIERAGRMRLAADVTPDHFLRDIITFDVDRELGPERAPNAHAYKSMLDAGMRLNLVSDWPGSFYKASGVAPLNPVQNIYHAVTRQDVDGLPEGGWHPEQRLTVEEAIRAVTLTPAETTFEEDRLGSITVGKLADLVVLSKDILEIPPRELLDTEVVYTVFDGQVVYQRSAGEQAAAGR